MGKRAIVTEADMRRALKVARENDPTAIVKVTRDGTIRILPSVATAKSGSDVGGRFDGQS